MLNRYNWEFMEPSELGDLFRQMYMYFTLEFQVAHFIRDPKGITYVRFFLQIESDAEMIVPNQIGQNPILVLNNLICCRNLRKFTSDNCTVGEITFMKNILDETSLKWLTVAMPLLEIKERLERDKREMELWLIA